MGNKISDLLTCIYTDSIERITLHKINVKMYSRYVDDIFMLAKSSENADNILQTFNEADPNIQFELEKPTEENSLSLLDITININDAGQLFFKFYRKPARTDMFMNAGTALPQQMIENIIRNERTRIDNRCSLGKLKHKEQQRFDERLRLNGFTEQTIAKTRKKKQNQQRHNESDDSKRFYLRIPFLNDTFDRRLSKIFRNNGMRVQIIHKTIPLSSTLRPATSKENDKCTLKRCPINNNKFCHQINVVYKASCNRCNSFYVGSTTRKLHTRIAEHLSGSKSNESSIRRHMERCGSTFTTSILTRERNATMLRIKEAIYIKKLQPSINKREELNNADIFII